MINSSFLFFILSEFILIYLSSLLVPPLYIAVQQGQTKMVKYLLGKGANFDTELLKIAGEQADEEIFKDLFTACGDLHQGRIASELVSFALNQEVNTN
jgi:hypothetical protein